MDEFEFQPTLTGPTLILRPLLAQDLEPLYAAASDPLIWEQHPDPQRYERTAFETRYFAGALDSGSALVVINRASGDIVGCSRYYEWNPETAEVAIGFTFLARSQWGGATNSELKGLMLAHAFRWAKRVWFHIGKDNMRSRRGTEKIGARFSHETQKELNGQLHDYAFYVVERSPQMAATMSSIKR